MDIITNRPSGAKIYDDIIGILNTITGAKWGFVKKGARVQYISCEQIPIRVGIEWGKVYEKNIKYKLDIYISNKFPRMFAGRDLWRSAITSELQVKLQQSDKLLQLDPQIIYRINSAKISDEFAIMLLFSEDQNKKYMCEGKVHDVWMNDCLRV